MSDHDERSDYDDWRVPDDTAPEPLLGYAKVLRILGTVQVIAAGIGLMIVVGKFISKWVDGPAGRDPAPDVYWMLAITVVGAGTSTLVIWGAAGMRHCRGYRRSVAAATLVAVPLPCFYLGVFTVPMGLVVLRHLLKPEVRSLFNVAPPTPIDLPPKDRRCVE